MKDIFYLLPLIAIIIHNIEEALWLPQWSKYAQKYHKKVEPNEFHFAVLIVTILAVLSTSLYIIYPNNDILKYMYFGLIAAMILNAFLPHFLATIVLKKYAPGVISAFLLIIPINLIVIIKSINNNVLSVLEIIISTIVVSILLLLILPVLFKLSKIIKVYDEK